LSVQWARRGLSALGLAIGHCDDGGGGEICVIFIMDEESSSSSSSSVAARATGMTGRDELTAVVAARRLREKRRQRTPPSTSDAKTHRRQSLCAREKRFLTPSPSTAHPTPDSTVDALLLVPPYIRDDILMMIHCNVWYT